MFLTCKSCGKEKPTDDFYSGKCYKNGFDIYCKGCAREIRTINRNFPKGTRHGRRNTSEDMFWCPKCKKYKSKDDFYVENTPRSPSGCSTYCKVCERVRHCTDKCRESTRKYYYLVMSNPDKVISERVRKLNVWRKYKNTPKWRLSKSKTEHKRRERIKNSIQDLTEQQLTWLLNFQDNRCAKCSKEFSTGLVGYEIDHIVPVSKGGNLTISNVQLLCKSCNCSKGDNIVRYINIFKYKTKEVLHG